MNSVVPKPFPCTTEVKCDVNFSSNNLLAENKQHDITLNLGVANKSSTAFTADQTPTPTRLIKNCEEVGLFDDLKHVNPFDETFRRAVESKNETNNIEIISVSEDLNQSENSLHTPQVFPHYETQSEPATTPIADGSLGSFQLEKQQIILRENISKENKRTTKKSKQIKKPELKPNIAQKSPNVLIAPVNPYNQIIVPVAVNFVATTPFIAFSMPEAPVKKRPILLPKSPVANVETSPPQQQLSVKEKLKAQLTNPKIKLSSLSLSDNSSTEKRAISRMPLKNVKRTFQDTREEQMARRRAAALRYRTKMKKETNDLKRRNTDLMMENKQLKEMVQHLKEQLKTHQHCSLNSNSKNIQRDSTTLVSASKDATPSIQIPIFTPVNLLVRGESVPLKINQCLARPEL